MTTSLKFKLIFAVMLAFVGLALNLAQAQTQNKVVVIPMAGDDLKPLKNIITVARENGGFSDPVAAITSITDAAIDNPYLIVIAPGVYTLSSAMVMQEYVDITGSGENITQLTGALSSGGALDSALVKLANNAALSNLSVENEGGSTFSVGVSSSGLDSTAHMENVTVTASGATTNYGIFNDSSSPTMTQITVTALGVVNNYGIFNRSSSPAMTQVTATASGGTTKNYGVRNTDSSPIMTLVTAYASGGDFSYGVSNNASSPTMTLSTATASNGKISYGVWNLFSSSPIIRRCTLEGDTVGLYGVSGTSALVSQSTIIGGVTLFGIDTCVAVASDNGAGVALNSDCTDPSP